MSTWKKYKYILAILHLLKRWPATCCIYTNSNVWCELGTLTKHRRIKTYLDNNNAMPFSDSFSSSNKPTNMSLDDYCWLCFWFKQQNALPPPLQFQNWPIYYFQFKTHKTASRCLKYAMVDCGCMTARSPCIKPTLDISCLYKICTWSMDLLYKIPRVCMINR